MGNKSEERDRRSRLLKGMSRVGRCRCLVYRVAFDSAGMSSIKRRLEIVVQPQPALRQGLLLKNPPLCRQLEASAAVQSSALVQSRRLQVVSERIGNQTSFEAVPFSHCALPVCGMVCLTFFCLSR